MIEKYNYVPNGVCSRLFEFEIDSESDTIVSLNVVGGCNGNLKGIARLIANKKVSEVVFLLSGVTCRSKTTSCPDQISIALQNYLDNKNK